MSGTDDTSCYIELLDWRAAAVMKPAWNALAARAVEPNVFMEPPFALAAAAHLEAGKRPRFLFVSAPDSTIGEDKKLIGVFALLPSRWFGGILRGWLARQAALGSPLLDKDMAATALQQALDWLARHEPFKSGMCWPLLAGEGPVATLIRDHAAARGLAWYRFDLGERAQLLNGSDMEAMQRRTMSRKHRRYLQLIYRRLAEHGEITYVSARQPGDIVLAVKEFLALEASGWKGRLGTALKSQQSSNAFARAMLIEQSANGNCHIDTLAVDGKPVAMGVVLTAGKNAYIWKIAFDEAFADYSPGAQFMREFSSRQAIDQQIARTDSCSIPGHPLFSQIWADRMPVADLAIALSTRRRVAFTIATRLDRIKRMLREFAKRLYYMVSKQRRS